MDIRNTVKNAALAAEFASLDELGQDVILVSSHAGARKKCYPYQGKFFSRSGKTGTIKDGNGKEYPYSPLSDTSFGEPDGLFGINCGHRMRGVSDGLFIYREKQYDEKENSEEYEKVCKQRQMERKIRKDRRTRDALEAAGDTEGAKELQRKIAEENKQLKEYCDREGLNYRQDRTRTYGYSDESRKKKPVDLAESVDKLGESGIMKMGKVNSKVIQLPPDFSKYKVVDDSDGVEKLKAYIISELSISEKQIGFDGLRNVEVARPFFERLRTIQEECGLNIPRIIVTDLIEGDRCCISSYKPFENALYISSRYFNSKDALLDTLKKWANDGIMPKQCVSIQYIAEHEAAHIRIPTNTVNSKEAMAIFKKRKLLSENDTLITEYYADVVAIFRTGQNPDENIIKAIEYLRNKGVVI